MAFPQSSLARSGKYAQIQPVGAGAGGYVYRATDNLRRVVAIKEALPSGPGFLDAQERFEKEVRLQAVLNHPNIIQVYHLEEDPQTHAIYLISEYANGGSLAERLQAHGPLPEPQAIQIALDLCAALEEVWGKQIVHRDLKPANILLCEDDHGQITAKLADFGVAKDLDARRAGQPTTRRGGAHPGTPEYMAPEQADITRPVDVRTDLYALGICLWEMLTGQDYKLAAASGPPELAAFSPQASQGIAEVIRRAVQADPRDRYATPRAMAADLQSVQRGRLLVATPTIALAQRPARPRRLRPIMVLIACAALILGGYGLRALLPGPWVLTRESENPDQATVGQPIPRAGANGRKVHGQFGSINSAPWSAQAGDVTYVGISPPPTDSLVLQLRYSKNSPPLSRILVYLDDEAAPRAIITPVDQRSWDSFVETEPIDLGQVAGGAHRIRFYTEGQQYGVADLDSFTLTAWPTQP